MKCYIQSESDNICKPPTGFSLSKNIFFKVLPLFILSSLNTVSQASEFNTLAVKGDVTYTTKGSRKELKPGTLLSAGNIIQSGASGQVILQLGSTFQIYQITSNTKALLTASGLNKL